MRGRRRLSLLFCICTAAAWESPGAGAAFRHAKQLYFIRHTSDEARAECLQAFHESQLLEPSWITSDSKLATSSHINSAFDVFERNGQCSEHLLAELTSFREGLEANGFTAAGVQKRLGVAPGESTCGPFYLKQSLDHTSSIDVPPPRDSLDTLIHFFLLGYAMESKILRNVLGCEGYDLCERMNMMSASPVREEMIVPHIQLFPMDLNAATANSSPMNLWLATDHAPPSSAALVEEPVMYISSCSVALMQHAQVMFHAHSTQKCKANKNCVAMHVLDICTGSGIQGLSVAKLQPSTLVTAIDLSPRAIRFARFNAALNGLSDRFTALEGDLYEALKGKESTQFDVILANPPFVPVPPKTNARRKRYDSFSVGPGARGDEILARIISGAPARLKPDGGMLGIVSELANADTLHELLPTWWGDGVSARGAVIHDSRLPSTSEYAARRAGSQEEALEWQSYMSQGNVTSMSQGFIFACCQTSSKSERKSKLGLESVCTVSLEKPWAPNSSKALEATRVAFEVMCEE